ncbi:DUF2993 domain-containing protein [Nocardia sp. NPDC051030]|uniref:LmeA family phospholipid-binding protein n=1 Tax=Nocardia sp. NPDC051030 TaxID=3155162 RepID=UPI0034141FD4
MSSKPTSDDAAGHAQDSAANGPSDESPTQVIGAAETPQHAAYPVDGGETEIIPAHGAQPAPRWDDKTTQLGTPGTGDQATSVLGAHDTGTQHTAAFDPGEAAAYAAGASSGPGLGQVPPVTPPPVNPVGGQDGMPPKKKPKRTLLIVGLVVALLIVGGLAGGEAYARQHYGNCVASQFEAQMGSKIDVSFGWKPLLLTAFDGKVSSATVDSDDTKFGPAQDMKVHAVFDDIDIKDNGKQGITADSSTADVTWSNAGIQKTLGGLVSGATSDPSKGTLSFAALGGVAQLQVKPKIVSDKIEVETLSASVLIFGLPTDLVSGIVQLMTESLQSYPMGLKPTKVEVTKDGLHISLTGGKTELQPADGKTTDTGC